MSEKQIGIEARRQAYLEDLYSQAVSGNLDAGGELSKIALGGYKLAQGLVKRMDEHLSPKTDSNAPKINTEANT